MDRNTNMEEWLRRRATAPPSSHSRTTNTALGKQGASYYHGSPVPSATTTTTYGQQRYQPRSDYYQQQQQSYRSPTTTTTPTVPNPVMSFAQRRETSCDGIDFDFYANPELVIKALRDKHGDDANKWNKKAGDTGGEQIFLRILHTNTTSNEQQSNRSGGKAMNAATLGELRRRLGLEVIFDPRPDGSCLFGALAAGMWGIPLSDADQVVKTSNARRSMAAGLLQIYSDLKTREEKFLFRSQVAASMDDQPGARLADMEAIFCRSPPSDCSEQEAEEIEKECSSDFVRWITEVYATQCSLQCSEMELVAATDIPQFGINVILIDGDRVLGFVEQGTRRIVTDAMASLDCIRWISRGSISSDSSLSRGESSSSTSTKTAARRTIVLERFAGHYRLLGFTKPHDWEALEAIYSVGVLLKCILKIRDDLANSSRILTKGATNDASSADDTSELNSLVMHAAVISKCNADLPLLYASFYHLWTVYVHRLY